MNVEVVGCPVRPAFRDFSGADLGAMRASFDLHPDRPMLLVTGASQGARTVNEAVLPLAGALSIAGWQVLHLAGKADAEQVQRAYADGASGVPHRVLGFTDRMPEAMAAADLIISRAGASTLSEIQAAGRPSILFPYPYHRDQHQRHNAAVLADAGAAILLEDAKDGQVNAGRLGPPLALLMGDPARRLEMGRCARALDRPDSAERIAAHLLSAAQVPTNIPCEISDCHAAQRCSNTEY